MADFNAKKHLRILSTCGRIVDVVNAAVAELADALDSKSSGEIRAGSSPASGILHFQPWTPGVQGFFIP